MQDIYLENVMDASVENGIVTIRCGVEDVLGEGLPFGDGRKENTKGIPTVRIRIPILFYQKFAMRMRDILIQAMKDGWYGEKGQEAAKEIGKEAAK